MFLGRYLPAYSHCATGVNKLTLTHTYTHTKLSLISQALRSAAGLQFAQSSLTAGCKRMGMVVWPWPDKAAAPFLFYLSVITHLHPSVYPCTHLTHRLPSTNTCSRYHCLCLKTSVLAGLCLCPCPHHLPPYPEPPALATA